MICGLDLGSRQVKLIIMNNEGIVKKEVYQTANFYKEKTTVSVDGIWVNRAKLNLPENTGLIATGYGRNNLGLKGTTQITEVKAQVWGVIYQTGIMDFSLLDIGGQDIKVIRVKNGRTFDIHMNDKCAAGSGRYLENMAAIIGVDFDEIAMYHEDPVHLDATCAIYGESELIGKLAEGCPVPKLCAGVNKALCRRIIPMVCVVPKQERFFCSGGVARNRAIIHFLRKEGYKAEVLEDPVSNGAIGCAFWGLKYKMNL